MKELVEVIASALVDSPEDVVVTETEDEKQILLDGCLINYYRR